MAIIDMLCLLVITFLLFDAKYRNCNLIKKIIPIFTLDKMFFNKNNGAVGMKITAVYFFLSGAIIIQSLGKIDGVRDNSSVVRSGYRSGYAQAWEDIYGAGTEGAAKGVSDGIDKARVYAESYSIDMGDVLELIGVLFVGIGIWWLILRLVFEFIVIPIAQRPRVPVQYQNQVQQPIQQMSVTTPNIQIIPQDLGATNIAAETQTFVFCSQCGTKYNASAENCPKCGMK